MVFRANIRRNLRYLMWPPKANRRSPFVFDILVQNASHLGPALAPDGGVLVADASVLCIEGRRFSLSSLSAVSCSRPMASHR